MVTLQFYNEMPEDDIKRIIKHNSLKKVYSLVSKEMPRHTESQVLSRILNISRRNGLKYLEKDINKVITSFEERLPKQAKKWLLSLNN